VRWARAYDDAGSPDGCYGGPTTPTHGWTHGDVHTGTIPCANGFADAGANLDRYLYLNAHFDPDPYLNVHRHSGS
jgi:hypothetical protein